MYVYVKGRGCELELTSSWVDLWCSQIYILCRFISAVVKGNTSVGEGRGNISDNRLAKFHCPKLCSVRQSFGHHLN